MNEEIRPEYTTGTDLDRIPQEVFKQPLHSALGRLIKPSQLDCFPTKSTVTNQPGSSAFHASLASRKLPLSMISEKDRTGKDDTLDSCGLQGHDKACCDAETPHTSISKQPAHLVRNSFPGARCPVTEVSNVTFTSEGHESNRKLTSKPAIPATQHDRSVLLSAAGHGWKIKSAGSTLNRCDSHGSKTCKKTALTSTEPLTSNCTNTNGNVKVEQQNNNGMAAEEKDRSLVKPAGRKRKRGRRGRGKNGLNENSTTMAEAN